MGFLDENYLIRSGNTAGKKIFNIIENLPIIDAHNHSNVKEIRENLNYPDIWFIEAATDHYVWELLRKRGVSERYITGEATPEEKWMKLASVFEELVGNPTYEWVHLDLKRRFNIDLLINSENAKKIWDMTQEIIQHADMKPQALLKSMNVEVMCSTDDPLDLLEDHQELAKIAKIPKILPTWRPDKAMNIFKPDFVEYIKELGARVGTPIKNMNELIDALQKTHDYFEQFGARATDHGIEIPFGYYVDISKADEIFQRRIGGQEISTEDIRAYISFMMHQFARMNAKSGWVMQIHIGAVRNYRNSLYADIGPDSGGDIIDHSVEIVGPLKDLLNEFDGKLKFVLYSMEPNHITTLASISRAFGKNVSIGSAWWLNDSPIGMKRQLEYVGTVDLLMNHAGMVSDSRKLMSYGSRTEMFRRVLADVLGDMVMKGQVPEELAIKTAKYICYEGPKALFGF